MKTKDLKKELQEAYGSDNVFTTDEVCEKFIVESFLAPLVFCTRKVDGVKGTLEFTHSPRWYFNWIES